MKKLIFTFFCIFVLQINMQAQNTMPAIVIHGGAGTMAPGLLSDSLETEIRQAMKKALDEGYQVMKRGGTAMQAVETAITVLEDSPAFNAGRGAVMTHDGRHELDASIMDGSTLNAGAVAGITTIKNPIKAALAVMNHSSHVLLAGEGAEKFASDQGLKVVKNSYFTTESVKSKWQSSRTKTGSLQPGYESDKFGTVGAVAIDKDGNIAAGTSTGGMMGKRYNRIGDSPLIGAGTYADNATCGVSCTGHGEFFIRLGIAKEVSDQMMFGSKSLMDAARHTIQERLGGMKGQGGLIAIDRNGNIVMEFNTPGMYRGYRNAEGSKIQIYKD